VPESKTVQGRSSPQFAAICDALLQRGLKVRFRARGASMQPNILDGDAVVVAPAAGHELERGDVVLARGEDGFRVHRVVQEGSVAGQIITRGDAGRENDPATNLVLGKVIAVDRGDRRISLGGPATRFVHASQSLIRRARQAVLLRLKRVRSILLPVAILMGFGAFLSPAPAAAQADLQVTSDTAAPTTIAPGGQITYTVVVINNGPNAANVPSVTMNTPANTTYVSAAKAGGGGTWNLTNPGVGGTGAITFTRTANMGNGSTTTFTFIVQVNAGTANGTVIADSVTISSTTADPTPGNNTATANVTVQTPDLSMTQTAAPNPVATGANITYTETVTNSGPDAAVNATLTQNTPANTTFVSATPPGGWTCGTVPAVGGTGAITCTANGTMASGTTTTNFTIVVNVNAAAPGGSTITNTATVSETGTDPTPADNTTTTSVSVTGADLALTQTASATAVAPGATITYTETVKNLGPNDAVGATLYQQTPINTVFASITPPAGWTCPTAPAVGGTGQVICTAAGNIVSGAAAVTFTYVVTVNGGTAAGTTVVNAADVTAQTSDPAPSNNVTTTSVLVEITGDADLALSMTASPTPVFVSSSLSYTILVTNQGLAAGTGVTVTDTLPAALANASATTTQGTCAAPAGGKIVCTLNTVAYPLASPIIITVTGTTPATAGTLTNVATVATTGTDPVAANNTVTVLTVVQPLVCATPGKDGAPGTPLTGVVNTYYAGVGTAAAGSTTLTVTTPSSGSATQIGVGDLLLVIQMQGAQINSTNTDAYGDGVPGLPASGSTSLGNSGEFEFVTVTAITVGGGTDTVTISGTGAGGGLLNTYASVAASNVSVPPQGIQTFQVIRVPQYAAATLSSTLAAFPWNGAVGGILALDVASQLTLGGSTVSLDGQGFRGAGGRILAGGTGAGTDDITLSTDNTNGGKAEGIAGTPHYIAPALGTITPATTAVSTGQAYLEGLPNGSYARGAPGNAGGGATDANPPANDQNSGGGAGGNGGTGGVGGFAWNSAGFVGGFGGVAFPASTSAIVMGGGGGAGTTNNGSTWDPVTNTGNSTSNTCPGGCTGIFSSGTAGGGIVIVHAGSVVGTGTITANGQTALQVENDGGGGGGAGGTILVFANSGGLGGLTASAVGGNGGITWPEQAPAAFPGNRHGPGGGGGGGVILASSAPGSTTVSGGIPGTTTLANDAYGATAGQPGTVVTTGLAVMDTPGTQSGAYCAGADLAVTDAGTPNPVLAGGNITYTQTVTNNGPRDAVNAVFSEAIPANTTFQSLAVPAGWTCTTPAVNGTGNINCTNPDVANAAAGTFTLVVQVNAGTAVGTVITNVVDVTSGTNDPNLANNSAMVQITVGSATTADLSITNSATPNPVLAGANITYTVVVKNNGVAAATNVSFSEAIPANTTFVSDTPIPGGWACSVAAGTLTCTTASLAANASATFTIVMNVNAGTASGTVITDTADVSATTPDPNPNNNSATVTVVVATAGQADMAVTSSATPNPVTAGNNITYTQTATNNGPASAAGAKFVDTLPANTTFVSFVQPAGWTCVTPAVGATGTVTCNANAAVPSGATANFPLVVKVNLGTAPGTNITNTPTVSATPTDPNNANNSASTTVVVASPSQSDVAIQKTASPEPVNQGTNLTYTLQVTNNGPAVATGVTVSDPLPAQVTFVSVSTTQGSCSQAAGTVSCTLNSISVGGLVLITINVTANTFSSATLATNTATVASTTSDPNATNNSSTATSTIATPTAVQLYSFRAMTRVSGGGILLEWRTREEIRNLGFNVYREDAQGRHRLNPSVIAGSALLIRGGRPQHAAKTYQWLDPDGNAQSSYSLEDVDLNGTRSSHGPVHADAEAQSSAPVSRPLLLTQLNRATAQVVAPRMRTLSTPIPAIPELARGEVRLELEEMRAVKISVRSEGWYQVSRAQLVAAGLDPDANARDLQLFAEGVEQPILILGRQNGPLGTDDSIEFYGTGIDTPFSDARVYWLVRGSHPGKRIVPTPATHAGLSAPQSFLFTVVREDRTTYFGTLLNGENLDNFFGATVTSEPVGQELITAHSDPNSSLPVTLDVRLQGATDAQDHRVSVAFNGASLGEVDFTNFANVTNTFTVDRSLLRDGANTVTLTALEGDNDVSVVQSIELHYPHTYAADTNWLKATAPAGDTVHITGFSNPQIHVFDITDPIAVTQFSGVVALEDTSYGVTLALPGSAVQQHTLLAFSDDQVSAPSTLTLHRASALSERRQGGDIVVITHPDFESSLAPLVKFHESQGQTVELVTVDQIFDAFNFGERSPFAIRDFLQHAVTHWGRKPHAILLVGDASLDPRNYLGFGDFDFVPTRIIETVAFKTASDDWFSDFRQNGFATIPTGRLPVRTVADADLVVSKIVNYEKGIGAGTWNQQALVIADQNIGDDFTTASNFAAANLPSFLNVTTILANGLDPNVARQQIITALNNGALLVNYEGHGSVEQWSFADFLDDSSASALSNGNRLPVYLMMDCLNGFFHDVFSTSLAESLLLAPNGGAVAVWASSGFTIAPPQAAMDQALLAILKAHPSMPLGRAVLDAKSGVTDQDVRRTWIFFGDPAMKLQLPSTASNKNH
jgi:uncharacterized repeat protein (TIGR01451 family)